MALDPNIGRIKFLRSKTAGRKPTTSDLDEGELALNLVDRTIYTRNGNNIVDIGFGLGGQVNGNITTSGTVKATELEGPLTGNAASATKLQTARAINGVSFDGTANIEVPIKTIRTTAIEMDNLSESVFFRSDAGAGTLGIHIHNPADYRYAYQLSQDSSYKSIGLKARVKSGGTWSDYKSLAFTDSDITGNSATATKLQTARTIGITGAVTATAANFDGTSNININATSLDATKLSGTVPNASLNGLYSNVTLDVSNGLVYSLKQPGGNNSVTAYGLGSIRAIAGTTQNSVIVIKTNIPKGSSNVLSLHIKGLSDSETKNIDITISGWIRGNISKLSLGTKDYIVRKADSSDGYLCFVISHPSGYLGTSTAFSIVTAHLNFGVDVSTLNNWTIFETTDLSTFTNISQPAPQSTSIVDTYWDNIQSKPTNLAGYGITDTYTRTELDARYSLRTSGVKAITLSTTNLTYTNDNNVSTSVAVPTWNQSTTGNAASATKLQTSRTIGISGASGASGSVSFDGTENALIPLSVITQPTATNNLTIATTAFVQAVNSADTGSAATALALKTARLIGVSGSGASGSVSFDGSSNVNIPLVIATQPTTTNNTTIATTAFVQAVNAADTGSAATALALKTARTINGTSFNGSANITTANWGTARNFTIGSTTRSVNGASNLSWTLTDIGALGVNANAVSATKLQTPRKVNGVDFDGTTDIQIDAIRVGTITWHLGERSSIFAGDLSLDGQILNRVDYAELWDMVSSGRFKSVTDAVWLDGSANRGCYSTGNGTTTFRLPDLNGMQVGSIQSLFLRGSSTTPVGTVLSDAIRNITGVMGNIRYDNLSYSSVSGVFEYVSPINNTISYTGSSNTTGTAFKFDASKVVPTDDENRPKSVFGIWVVSAKGSNVVVPGGSTAATLTGGNTFQGSQTINGDLIVNQNETVKGNLTVEGLTADRFGLHDKMHWVGASVKPYGTSVLNASVTTNTFQVIIRGESGAKYWTKGRTKLHFIINHGAPQNARFVTATVTDWSTTDSNKQTITATLSLVNHAMPLNTVFHWVGSTYESFGCDWAGWMNIVGDSRLVMRLKPTTPLKSLAPIITSSCSSDVYWNASQLSQPGVEPQQRSGMGSIVINSVHEGDVVFAIGDNNTDGSVSNEYVSISVKDFV